jgi:hypothetical protein
MCHVLRAGTEMEDWNKLRAGVDGQPQPQQPCGAAQPGAQFIQLQMREPEMAEEAFVQGLCMFPGASQPGADGGLSVAEDPFGSGRVQPFSQREIRTIATCWEGVFNRYKGVCRRALKVVRQARPRNVWMRSAWPCLPSPTSAWM